MRRQCIFSVICEIPVCIVGGGGRSCRLEGRGLKGLQGLVETQGVDAPHCRQRYNKGDAIYERKPLTNLLLAQ